MSRLRTVAIYLAFAATISWAQWVLPPLTPIEAERETWRLNSALGFSHGRGKVTSPYSIAVRDELAGGVNSKYLTVKAHALHLTLNLIKNVEIPRETLADELRSLGDRYATEPPELTAGVVESTAADLPALVSNLSNRVLWEVDLRTAADSEEKYTLLTQALEGIEGRDRSEREYYALEAADHLAQLSTGRAREIILDALGRTERRPRLETILSIGLRKVDVKRKALEINAARKLEYLVNLFLKSPQSYEATRKYEIFEQQYLLWLLDRIAEIEGEGATVFLRKVLTEERYSGRLRYKAQELLVERGDLERHFQVLPPIPA